MNDENILEEKIKVKSKFKIALIIIAILLIILIGIEAYTFFKSNNAKDVYFNIIDSFNSKLVNDVIPELEKNEIFSLTGNINIDMNADEVLDTSTKNLANVLNNLKFQYGLEFDVKNKKENIKVDATYENKNLANLNMNVIEDSIYLDLGSLYDKLLKINNEELDSIWKSASYDNFKTLAKEFSVILKNNLKDEYFVNSKETIEINGKNISANKYTLKIEGTELYNFENSLLNDIKKNENIISIVAELNEKEKEDIINEIDKYIYTIEKNENYKFSIEIFTQKINNEILNVVLTEKEDILDFTYTTNDTYDITYKNILIGNMIVKNNEFEISYKYEDMSLTMKSSEKDFSLNISDDTTKLELIMTKDGEKINILLNINTNFDGVDANIKIDGIYKPIEKVSEIDVSNAISFDDLTESDINIINENMFNNETLMSLMEDIASLDIFSTLMTY